MRAFIVMCLVAVAWADKLGYNYQPAGQSGAGLSISPGSGSAGLSPIDGGSLASLGSNGGAGNLDSGLNIGSLGGLSGLGGNSGLSGGNLGLSGGNLGLSGGNLGLSGGNLGLPSGNLGLSGGNLGLSGSNLDQSGGNLGLSGGNLGLPSGNLGLSGGNLGLSGGNLDQSGGNKGLSSLEAPVAYNAPAPAAELEKEFFTYTANEEDFDEPQILEKGSSSLNKGLRVVFIKGPENRGLENAALALAKQAAQQETAIYVLNKQADISDLAQKLNAIRSNTNNKPEVHFVKYRTPEDALNAQRAIQGQYDQLGGSSQSHDGGVAPALNFASQGPVRQATAQTPDNSYLPSSVFRRF